MSPDAQRINHYDSYAVFCAIMKDVAAFLQTIFQKGIMRYAVHSVVFLLVMWCCCACEEYPLIEDLVPGTFNLTTVITDGKGRSTDIAGDWAVFHDPDEVQFTHYIHFDQVSQTGYNILDNEIFIVNCLQGKEDLPVYDGGVVDKRKALFPQCSWSALIYLDGRIHPDYRDTKYLYHASYGNPYELEILDDDTILFLFTDTYTQIPASRLRRIHAFAP